VAGVPLSAFDELAIPEELIKKEVTSIRIVSPLGEILDIPLRGGSLAIIERGEFDSALRFEAAKKGVEIREGEMVEIAARDKGYRVVAHINGIKTEIVAEYVIAADGVNSRVRACFGISPGETFITVSERIKGIETDICEFWFSSSHAPGFYSWVFPAKEGIMVGTGSEKAGNVLSLFERFKQRRGITEKGPRKIYKIPIWDGALYNKGRVIFVGDAAGQVMPLSCEGIYYGMKAGEFAARAVIEEKIAGYKKMWKAAFQKRFSLMKKLADYFLKNDRNAERLVALHRRPEVQEASMRLWLRKESGRESLQTYIKLFKKFLC